MRTDRSNYQAPRLIPIPGNVNDNGSVHFWENSQLFPQGVLRCFWISGVKVGEPRGNHAHWEESQVIVALTGKLDIKVEGIDGTHITFHLEGSGTGLYIPPLNWIEIRFSSDAVLLGLGDRVFSEEDYIRDHHYFGSLQKGNH
ncbi:MAG TPA: FdtA/QdtA family cupin domain-containing protein [Algoriphagus sp.]|nr:FdtA/QdtA family cupin domain-containing protein [Algoriphagus sp.]